MLKMLTLLAAAVAVSSTALAADMPVKSRVAQQPEPTYVQIWTGVYFGGQAGWANLDTDPSFLKTAASGFTYGGHVGFMKQLGSIVIGVEGGVDDFSNVKTNGTGCDCIVADVVAKLGFTPTTNTLLYVLGGGFWHNANMIGIPNFGWEVGGGAAWKPFDNHWTVSVEYKYRDLDLKQLAPINIFSHGVQGKLAYQF